MSDKNLIEQLRYKATIISLRESGAINLMKDAADRLEKQVVVSKATTAFIKARTDGFNGTAEWHEMLNAIILLEET